MRASTAAVIGSSHATLAGLYREYAGIEREQGSRISVPPELQPKEFTNTHDLHTQLGNLYDEASDLHGELAVKWRDFAVFIAMDGEVPIPTGVEYMEHELWIREVEIERLNDEILERLNEPDGTVEPYDHDHPNDTHCLYLGSGLWACGVTDQH